MNYTYICIYKLDRDLAMGASQSIQLSRLQRECQSLSFRNIKDILDREGERIDINKPDDANIHVSNVYIVLYM